VVGNTEKSATPPRDLRIDFFRGVALYMIIFDHIPGDPLGRLTYTHLGFSDAAEIFVFLSGVSCGIVYARILSRRGPHELLRATFRRALQIYIYYLVASITTILLITLSRDIVAIPSNHQAFITLREDPLAAIRSAIFLISPPALPGILVLYLELTLVAIPLFLLMAAVSKELALLASGIIYGLSQAYPDFLRHLADHSYFNPLAWQFLFCIGMFVGTLYNTADAQLETFRTRRWLLAAWMVVGSGLIYKLARLLLPELNLNLGMLALSDATLLHMKENLAAIRLLHFLSVAILVATYVKKSSALLSWPGASAVIRSGRCSLQVFCLGAILSVLLNLFVAVDAPFLFERLLLDAATVLIIASAATLLIRFRPERSLPGARPIA
jgi:hypothetical protein